MDTLPVRTMVLCVRPSETLLSSRPRHIITGRLLRLLLLIAALSLTATDLSSRLLKLVLGSSSPVLLLFLRWFDRLLTRDSRKFLVSHVEAFGSPCELQVHFDRELRPCHHNITDVRPQSPIYFADSRDGVRAKSSSSSETVVRILRSSTNERSFMLGVQRLFRIGPHLL